MLSATSHPVPVKLNFNIVVPSTPRSRRLFLLFRFSVRKKTTSMQIFISFDRKGPWHLFKILHVPLQVYMAVL
jgi:hypothetical protein